MSGRAGQACPAHSENKVNPRLGYEDWKFQKKDGKNPEKRTNVIDKRDTQNDDKKRGTDMKITKQEENKMV